MPKVRENVASGELQVLPDERRNEVLGLIDQDIPDFSVSRERVKWGIPLPFDRSQVAYVWVDALSNYLSGIAMVMIRHRSTSGGMKQRSFT